MAGATPAERGQDVSATGIALHEASVTQVEYKPFSEFTPEQLADLIDGKLRPQTDEGQDWRIEFQTGLILNTRDFSSRKPRQHSTIFPIFSFRGTSHFELDETVVVTKIDEPGAVSFVNPQEPFPVESGIPTQYSWVRVENRGISIETAEEGSSRVTDEIRHAAGIAWEVRAQIEAVAEEREMVA